MTDLLQNRIHAPHTASAESLSTVQLNLRGLKCPLPALRTRKALKGMASGTRIIVECTDPMAAIDIPNLVRETGDMLESQIIHHAMENDATSGDVLTFTILKI